MTRSSFRYGAALAAWLLAAGCEPTRYLYTPATTTLTSAEPAQSRNAEYPFPPDSPQGDIRLATSGLSKVSADAPNAVQLRIIVRNRSQERWVIDTREQTVVLATHRYEQTPAVLASAPTVVEVLPSRDATIDLAFTLPPVASKASEIPAFDAVWTVHVGARAITTRTTFERMVVPGVARDVPSAGYPFDRGMPAAGERLPGSTRWTDTTPLPERGLQ